MQDGADAGAGAGFAGLSLASATLEGFTETGHGDTGAAPKVRDSDAQSIEGALGLRFETAMAAGSGVFTPSLSITWTHEFGDTVQSVISAKTPRDAALIDAGASYTIGAAAEMDQYIAASTASTTHRQ